MKEIGFITQDVEKIFPSLIYTDPKGWAQRGEISKVCTFIGFICQRAFSGSVHVEKELCRMLRENILLSTRLGEILDD
jgi:hypothetical protein